MSRRRVLNRLFSLTVVLSLVLTSFLPALAQDTTIFLPITSKPGASASTPVGLFRTRVAVKTSAQWRDLEQMAPVFLDRGADWALLLVDDVQLTELARWRYDPEDTDTLDALVSANDRDGRMTPAFAGVLAASTELRSAVAAAEEDPLRIDPARAALRASVYSLAAEQLDFVLAAASADSDGDGLNDTLESYWCTDPARVDSDFDGTQDGAEVTALKAWMNNGLSKAPSSGKPFQGWPPQKANCFDDDQDSVPDIAEALELGLNANRESTDRDKFDDGQELFGQTYCTGQGGFCSYGPLPRNEDWGVIFAEMPSWVKAPGHHPLVAAFPVPEVDVVESSLSVETVTEVTSGQTIGTGTERSYTTAKTQGTSTSLANTVTWNEWQEASESLQRRVAVLSSATPPNPVPVPTPAAPPGLDFSHGNTTDVSIGFPPFDCFEIEGKLSVGSSDLLPVTVEGEVGVKVNSEYWNLRCRRALRAQGILDNDSGNTGLPSGFDPGILVGGFAGMQYAYLNSGAMIADRLYDISQVLAAPVRTTTQTSGRSNGGAQTTTHEQYEEQTVTNGESFLTEESWAVATAVDSAHAADLSFTYQVRNTGTEYAREIGNLAFNLYIGDDPNPAYTYFVAPDVGGAGKFVNFMPSEEHTYTSRRIPLSLEQMKAIDLGGPIRIVVEDFSYGIDELFYQDAANAGVVVAIEDGIKDGNESIDTYLVPTWGSETVLNVLARYLPHETDLDGTVTAIWTPEYRSDTPSWCQMPRRPTDQPSKAVWCKHVLSTADWWNVYTDGLGDSSEGFQDSPAAPGATALFRFNQDSDLDGFSNRSEARLGTDPNDASSFPWPEVLAGVHNLQAGNKVTGTLSLLNTGLYDAYGVEAVMVAPDDSISINNNTVGGSGRVKALTQVIVGSRTSLQSPLPAPWTQANHAVPAPGGYYTGGADRIYTFTVNCGAGGCAVGEGSWTLAWNDGKGASGSLPFGASYRSPTFLTVGAFGVTLALYTGHVQHGESFTVAATTPRDTFQYTINRSPHTPPLVIVSYNDPQGNHRFVVPSQAMSLTAPTANLQPFAGQMLEEVGVEIVTQQPFAPSANRVQLLVNNPSDATLQNARLFLEFINISGTVVSEVPAQVTLPPGPTYTPVSFNTGSFNPAFDATQDYIVMAFLTDYQGNILDTAGRPLSSFQADPLPKVAVDATTLTWNFGTVAQGALLKHSPALANVGYGRLYTYLSPTPGLSLAARAGVVGAADLSDYELILRTADLPVGTYERTATLKTSDPTQPALTVRVQGTVTAAAGDTAGGLQRPLDWPVTVTGPKNQGEWVDFMHTLGPDPQSLHPVKVYPQDYTTFYGVGRYATDFSAGTASYDMFGDGRDGAMPSSGNLDNNNGFGTAIVNSGSAGATSINVTDASAGWRINVGDAVLIHQTQGTGAGCWEMNKAVSDYTGGTAAIQLATPLKCNYVSSGNNHAQVVRVPQYSICNVTGTVAPLYAWNGSTGGIFAVLCNGTMTVSGSVDASGTGYRGGLGSRRDWGRTGQQGESYPGMGSYCTVPVGSCTINKTNNGGGGGSNGEFNGKSGGGTGAGHSAVGQAAWSDNAAPGTAYGDAALSGIYGGSGGGAGYENGTNVAGGDGGNGGGIVILYARGVQISGLVRANGRDGGSTASYPGGGGSGGSIKIVSTTAMVGTAVVTALGGAGGRNPLGDWGGSGSAGRIRIEYCEFLAGSTNPSASTQKLTCYVVEQTESSPYMGGRFNLPENITTSKVYQVQYARRLSFAASGNQTTTLRVPAGMASTSTVQALVSGLPANASFSIDIGNNGSNEWSGTAANNSTNNSPDLAAAFNAWWVTQGAPVSGSLDVPVKVTMSQPGQVLLTNLQVTTAGSKLRTLRINAGTVTQAALDLALGGSGQQPISVAVDVGADGSLDWTSSVSTTLPVRLTTGNLATAISSYLAGKSGPVDVPIRIYVAPDVPVALYDAAISMQPIVDLAAGGLGVGGAVVASASSATAYLEGDHVPVQATLSNPSSQASGPVTAAFFATVEGWGDWYIGSVFVANIPANGSAPVAITWDTTGFSGNVPVKVVVNPYGRTPETSLLNNSQIVSVTVAPNQTIQTITFGALANRLLTGSPFTVTATASSGLAVVFSSSTPDICIVSGAAVRLLATGTCTLRAAQPGNAFFFAATPVTRSFLVTSTAKSNQTITFQPLSDRTLDNPPFTLSAAASSALAVSFNGQSPSVCAVAGATVTLLTTGTCTVQAIQNGNASYNPAPPVTRSFAVLPGKAEQSITFAALPNRTLGEAPFTVSATATSGLPVAFSSLTASICTVNGATVTLIAVGTCTVRAVQVGGATFNAAPAVDRSFTVTAQPVSKQEQTIIFVPLPNKTLGDAPFTLAATASSRLPVAFASLTTGVCTVSGATATLAAIGICTIRAMQVGNATYSAAPIVTRSFSVTVQSGGQQEQSITFAALSDKILGDASFTLSASASSGLSVAFVSLTTAVCTVSGATVTLVTPGTCTIKATQAGNDSFKAAEEVIRSFVVQAGEEIFKTFLPVLLR